MVVARAKEKSQRAGLVLQVSRNADGWSRQQIRVVCARQTSGGKGPTAMTMRWRYCLQRINEAGGERALARTKMMMESEMRRKTRNKKRLRSVMRSDAQCRWTGGLVMRREAAAGAGG